MNANIDKLLTRVYELEGLLLVMQRHHDDVPQAVIDSFHEKLNTLHEEAKFITTQDSSCATQANWPVELEQPHQPIEQPELGENLQPDEPQFVEQSQATEPQQVLKSQPEISNPAVRNIMESFTINDRFLFLRELFDGDSQRFNDTIELMQGMKDIDSVTQFITDVLHWNTGDEVVKEFVRLVGMSFK